MSSRGQSSQACPPALSIPQKPVLFSRFESEFCRGIPALRRSALPGALTPPASLARFLSSPGVATRAEGGLSRRHALRCGGSTCREVRRMELQSLTSGACHQWSLTLGLPFKFAGVWLCLFKDQASLRQDPSAVAPATTIPAAEWEDS